MRLFPSSVAAELTSRGFALAAIDAPEHGERAPDRDPVAVARAWQQHWAEQGAAHVAADYAAVIDAITTRGDIATNWIGWWGLSLGTQYGIGVLASERRISAAVLGLFGLPEPGVRMHQYAPRVRCPVFFIQQLDDELHSAGATSALVELIGSAEKELCASPGGHIDVPVAAFERAYAFLERELYR